MLICKHHFWALPHARAPKEKYAEYDFSSNLDTFAVAVLLLCTL